MWPLTFAFCGKTASAQAPAARGVQRASLHGAGGLSLPPWEMVYQQSQRWIKAGVFEAMCHDLRVFVGLAAGRQAQPSAVILDSRTVQSTPDSGARAGYDGYKRREGSKAHVAVETLGHLLAVHVTPANKQERDQVSVLAEAVQEVTGENVQVPFVDPGYTGDAPAQASTQESITLEVVKLSEAKRGIVLLPRRWVVELSFGWLARCRRVARDYLPRLPGCNGSSSPACCSLASTSKLMSVHNSLPVTFLGASSSGRQNPLHRLDDARRTPTG